MRVHCCFCYSSSGFNLFCLRPGTISDDVIISDDPFSLTLLSFSPPSRLRQTRQSAQHHPWSQQRTPPHSSRVHAFYPRPTASFSCSATSHHSHHAGVPRHGSLSQPQCPVSLPGTVPIRDQSGPADAQRPRHANTLVCH